MGIFRFIANLFRRKPAPTHSADCKRGDPTAMEYTGSLEGGRFVAAAEGDGEVPASEGSVSVYEIPGPCCQMQADRDDISLRGVG